MGFQFAGESHIGCVYDHNEDAIGWSIPHNFWFVADGMGGFAKGDVASRIVKQAVLKGMADPDLRLDQLALDAHRAVVDEAKTEGCENAMGSTLTMLQIVGRECRVVWVGDSRAYLWRKGKLGQINRDHTLVQSLVDEGALRPDEVIDHPRNNELLQALGVDDPAPEAINIRLKSGDWLILCSDGLHDVVPEGEVAAVLSQCERPNDAAQKLIQASLDRHVDDNVSVIVIECPEFPPEGIREHLTSALGST